jgi:hypothetical protein
MSKTPKTAKEALDLWDAGEAVPAFQVESEGSDQEEIWGYAFEMIREPTREDVAPAGLTDRECDVAYSIAQVAKNKGWALMVAQHVGPQIPAIQVQKRSKEATKVAR